MSADDLRAAASLSMAAGSAGRPAARDIVAALVGMGVLATEAADRVRTEQARTGRSFESLLKDEHGITELQWARALAATLGFPFLDLDRHPVDPGVSARLPEQQARRWRALLIEERANAALVGFVDPRDLRAQDQVSTLLRRPLDVVVIGQAQFNAAFDRLYRKSEQIGQYAREVEQEAGGRAAMVDLPALGQALDEADAPVVKLLHSLFEDAARTNASDIHIEPQEKGVVVRFRIDGVLHVQVEASRSIAPLLLVRLKLMAGLDIAERRLPQDGRIAVRTSGAQFDVRVSTLPTQHGESVVMRLLRQDAVRKDLRQLMAPHVCDVVERVIRAPHGIVLVTGPTGSGKSTTLYAALEQLNDPGVKILTAEDPVEYRIRGISQVQINEKIGLGFAKVLRSFLRQDPDIILVGEIRDSETAEIAVRAAMTGHLVLSTLHTNDARSTPLRLMDMGVPRYMLANSLLAVLSQRLIRLVCRHCAEPVPMSADKHAWLARYLEPAQLADVQLMQGRGCPQCSGSGYSGRCGVHEVLEMTPALSAALRHDEPAVFQQAAQQQLGQHTLAHNALQLVVQGRTTLAEAMTVIELDT